MGQIDQFSILSLGGAAREGGGEGERDRKELSSCSLLMRWALAPPVVRSFI